ncbi:uncharacterized protein TRUGW13939_04766 [Talaromyces rugulosus]|uniref:Major facilitator superfamily (MFS) profile domain-containing protein n=1 Tax=Talaromyces rugulosus TaxID=121627 RepID=A0A7H8QV91_TALRU|nr:uncharacterized protein TRUGW13939_04766 [Talaromyces rugulosus]QKX57648.1 hypothetical protein TRUGW13939_04766 [Talaromyces rugulosus]
MGLERTLENDIEALEAKDRHDACSSEHGPIIQKTDAPVETTKPSNGRPPHRSGTGASAFGDHFSVTNNGELSWYIASFALITGTFILVAGRLGDMYGLKRILIIGFLIYGLWSLIAGAWYFLRSIDKLFVVARALQGIGASLLLPNAVAILGRTYPPGMRKSMVMSLFGAFAPGGYILGFLFSSIFAQFTIWVWAYFAMAIACAVLATMAHFVIPASPPKPNIDRTFDWLGFGLGFAGLVLFNVAWNQGPTVGWPTPYVYVLLILGVLAFVAFVIVEIRTERPLVPVQQLNLHIAFQFLEELRGVTPLLATAQNTPSAISGFVASVTTGILIGKIGVPPIMILAMLAFLISNILVATMPGMDMSFPAAVIMLSAAVPPEHQGIAASLALTTTNYAMSIGLGIAGTAVSSLSDGSDLLADCRHAWYMGIGLSGLGMVISMISLLYERRHPTLKPH